MGVTLAAVADDGDLLAFDQVDVGVAIIVNAHGSHPCSGQVLAAALLLLGSMTRRDKSGGEDWRHMPSGPRPIATMPVRQTSTTPSGISPATKLSIFSLAPLIS